LRHRCGAARGCDAALAAVQMLEPASQATVLGRTEKVDIGSAALLNGITSHTFDFDDTHLKTIIHPAGPVASAVLALAELRGANGRDVVDALVLASTSPAASATPCTRTTTTAAGTSPAPPACSAPPPAAPGCSASTSGRRRWRSASPPRSRSACASSSAP
jgi:hypothetical protein